MEEKAEDLKVRKARVASIAEKAEPKRDEVSCYVKLQSEAESSNGPNKNVQWTFIVLKGNSIFLFPDTEKEDLLGIITMDNVSVTVPHKNWSSPTNGVILEDENKPIYNGYNKIYLYFAVGQELEFWFWKLFVAAQLTDNLPAILAQEEKIRHTFTTIKHRLFANGKEGQAPEAWANALLPRFWWNIFDNKSFHRFIVKRLGKRIARITDFPKFIESMVLHSIDMGPDLPDISNVTLVDLSDDGAVDIDLDLDYVGGFSMTIKIKTSMSFPGTSLELPATAIIHVQRLSGKVRVHVSPPPCERVWVGFHTLPETTVLADTQIAILDSPSTEVAMPRIATNIIKKLKADLTKVIVNKLKADILGEKMVLPNMDDFPIPYFTHHEGEEDENYIPQVILSREESRDQERKKRGAPSVLDISPAGVTILNKKIEGDQIFPLLKAYATKDGVKKLTTTGVRTLQERKPQIKENMEKGRQALMESGMTNPKNWKDPLYSNLESVKDSVVDGLYRYGVKKAEKDVPPDFPNPRMTVKATTSEKRIVRRRGSSQIGEHKRKGSAQIPEKKKGSYIGDLMRPPS